MLVLMQGRVQGSKFTFISTFFQVNLYSFFTCLPDLLPSQQISEGMSLAIKKEKKCILDLLAGVIYFLWDQRKS